MKARHRRRALVFVSLALNKSVLQGRIDLMFSPQPIGYVRSPYENAQQVPKGLGAKHDAEGILDNRPHGVFATRSPRRPNPIGFTVVELLRREGVSLHVRGVDMLDGTPILDLKPYLSSIPVERLRRGWLDEAESRRAK